MAAVPEITKVPLLVNVLKGVDISDDDIAKMVEEANKILKPAGVGFEFDKSHNINHNQDDGGNNDGSIQPGENAKLRGKGRQELEDKFGKGKGYKIYLTNEIDDNPNISGQSIHSPDTSVSFIQKGGTSAESGRTLAHEFCHTYTLGVRHVITPTENADGTGHSSDKGNLMAPHREDGGTTLTPSQQKEVQGQAKKRGTTVEDKTRQPLKTLHGSWIGRTNDALPGYINLDGGGLFAAAPDADLELSLDLRGLFPAEAEVKAQYTVAFNPGGPGAKTLEIVFSGRSPFTPPLGTVTATLTDNATGAVVPLEAGHVERVHEIIDAEPPSAPSAADHHDSIRQSVPLAQLAGLPAQAPITVRARDLATGATDEAAFVFDLRPPDPPRVVLSPPVAPPGATVGVSGAGFAPSGPLTLLIDDTPLLTTTAHPDGSFAASFVCPTLPPDRYFLTVRGADSRFMFAMLGLLRADAPHPPALGTPSLTSEPTVVNSRGAATPFSKDRFVGTAIRLGLAPTDALPLADAVHAHLSSLGGTTTTDALRRVLTDVAATGVHRLAVEHLLP